MILLCGIPSEPPLAMVTEQLERLGAHHLVFDQREWGQSRLSGEVSGGRVTGVFTTGDATIALETITGVFTRMMDDRRLPDLEGEPAESERRQRCRRFHATLSEWIEIGPAKVLNRARAQASNGSKPYQAQRIREHGFSTPRTLITNDPSALREFRHRHGRVIYKSASGVRSVVHELSEADEERIRLIRWCPVQFQEYVPGRDVRVHVVGREVFATEVASDGLDYRYATQDGGSTELSATTLPDEVASRCRSLAESLDLPLAGIDLRFTPDGGAVCFEVNPSPAFSYYESNTGQPIAAAIARYLITQ